MNLIATIEIYAYGTSEGVLKEWDTRGRSGNRWEGIGQQTHVFDPKAPLMRLELKTHRGNAPILFSNDHTLNWTVDSNDNLVVEVEEQNVGENKEMGWGQKTVYTIPKSNIRYWGIEERPANQMLIPHPPREAPAHV